MILSTRAQFLRALGWVFATCLWSISYATQAAPVPGAFEAERFDPGGEGVGYHDNTPGDQGNAGYGTDVDIFSSDNFFSPDQIVIKNFESGEWLAYTIDVPTGGNYDVEVFGATRFDFPNPSYHIEIDGANLIGTVTLPDTGGWDHFQWIGKRTIALTAGTHVLKIVSEVPYFALDQIRLTTPLTTGPYFGTPIAVPAEFEAEAFDRGGDGVGYHDTTAGNQGDSGFREGEDVDIAVTSDGGSGSAYVVSNMQPGEWLAYTISVATAGDYYIQLRAEVRPTAGPYVTYHVEVDGTNPAGRLGVGATLGYQWVGPGAKYVLSAGTHTLKVVLEAPYINLNSIRIIPTSSSSNPTPRAIPGVIEAENFDTGGAGAGYHENTPGNQGNVFRGREDVDIFNSNDSGSGSWFIVKNFEAGEWLAYTINVPESGNYDIELRAATNFDFPNSSYYVQVDGVNLTGEIVLPDTGGWDQYQWIGKRTIALTAGMHLLRIVSQQPYFGFNSFRVLPSAP